MGYQALFASMVCRWSVDSAEPCVQTVGADKILYNSKGTEAGVLLDVSDRYAQRFCDTKDLDGDNWTEVSADATAGENPDLFFDVSHTLHRVSGKKLCDNNGEMLTTKDGESDDGSYTTKNSMFPFQHQDRVNALAKSNTAYFISIIVVQWADLMICKTRSRSLFEQGMTNVFMNWSILFETILGAFLCYIPFANIVTQTQPVNFVWWTPAIPFSLTIYAYDELRKGAIRVSRRKDQLGWLEYNT